MANGIDSVTTAALLTAMNGGTAFAIQTPLRCLFLTNTGTRSADNTADTEIPTGSGYVQGVGSLVPTNPGAGVPLAFAAATPGAPSTQNSNVAATVNNMPSTTWGGNKIVDSSFTNRTVADGATTNLSTTITSATAAFVANDVGAIVLSTNIPSNTVIMSVTNGTTVVLSQACTATGTSQTFNIHKPAAQTTFYSSLASAKTVNLADTVTVPSGSWQTTLA